MSVYTKQLQPDDWEMFKSIRLFALKESAHAFGATYEKSSQHPKAVWVNDLSQDDRAVFGAFDDHKIVGLGMVRVLEDNPKEAGFYMGYIMPEYRGQGLSNFLYQARIDWAKNRGDLETVFTTNNINNYPAQAMNKKAGFELAEDQSVEGELRFELKI